MARVTVEDCVLKVPNRFELVLLAGQRAREITSGAPLTIDRDDDKNPVVALREIAEDTVPLDHLQDSLVRGMQKHVEIDEPEETPELRLARSSARTRSTRKRSRKNSRKTCSRSRTRRSSSYRRAPPRSTARPRNRKKSPDPRSPTPPMPSPATRRR